MNTAAATTAAKYASPSPAPNPNATRATTASPCSTLAATIAAAKVLHGLAVVALVAFGLGAGLGLAYFAAVVAAAVFIAYEHQLVRPGDLSRLDAAFFTMNGIVSIVVFLGALADRVL